MCSQCAIAAKFMFMFKVSDQSFLTITQLKFNILLSPFVQTPSHQSDGILPCTCPSSVRSGTYVQGSGACLPLRSHCFKKKTFKLNKKTFTIYFFSTNFYLFSQLSFIEVLVLDKIPLVHYYPALYVTLVEFICFTNMFPAPSFLSFLCIHFRIQISSRHRKKT